MNITLTVDFTGTPDQEDILAARHIVFSENQRRAALVPPLTALPTTPAAALRTSYLTVLTGIVQQQHADFIAHAKSQSGFGSRFSEAQLEQIRVNLTTRLNNGEAAAAIVTDTAG